MRLPPANRTFVALAGFVLLIAGVVTAGGFVEARLMSPMASTFTADEPKSALPKVGDTAPPFDLPASTGKRVKLSDYKGKTLVVYFYPKADTPGCTKQACGFRDSAEEYAKAGVAVVGISPDSQQDVTKFAEKFSLKFPLLADADGAICKKYGVWREFESEGKKLPSAARITFIINADGKVSHVFEKVNVDGHEREVLEAIRGDSAPSPGTPGEAG